MPELGPSIFDLPDVIERSEELAEVAEGVPLCSLMMEVAKLIGESAHEQAIACTGIEIGLAIAAKFPELAMAMRKQMDEELQSDSVHTAEALAGTLAVAVKTWFDANPKEE